jgi:NAD(P)H dehydrogenase (quinone)
VIAIFGATGRVGGSATRRLLEQGRAVRAVVRDQRRGAALGQMGAEVVAADLRVADDVARAVQGVDAVLVVCPMLVRARDAAVEMRATIEAIGAGLKAEPPTALIAISDYGAELDAGTGITMTFHELEHALRDAAPAVTFLRSAEHMHNWGRFVSVAVETGVLPSLLQPLTKIFPQVAARDVGGVAADLLAEPPAAARSIVHVEGPRRYTARDVAATLSELTGREVTARALPREEWVPALTRGGVGQSYAELVATMFDVHNTGRIDIDPHSDEVCLGTTELRDVLASQVR